MRLHHKAVPGYWIKVIFQAIFYSNSALLRTRGDAGTSGKPHDRKGKARDAGPLKVEKELANSGSFFPHRNKAKVGGLLYSSNRVCSGGTSRAWFILQGNIRWDWDHRGKQETLEGEWEFLGRTTLMLC